MNDGVIISETQSQLRKFAVRQPEFQMTLSPGAQFVEVARQIAQFRASLAWLAPPRLQ